MESFQFTAVLETFETVFVIEPWQVREGTCAFVPKLVTRKCPTPLVVEPIG